MKKYEAYKDSGIEWIGEIPKEWSILRMKHYFYMKGRIGWQGLKADEFIEDGPYLVTGTDFVNGKVCWERCYHISEERFNEAPEIHVQQGDLLITKDGTVGKLALIEEKPEKVSLNSHLLILRPVKGEINNHFVYWALQSVIFKDYVGLASSGSTMASLSQEKIGEFPLILPTLSEQQIIVSYLAHKIGQIDASISAINSQIDDLKDYRQSIINEVVTKGLNPDVKMKDSGVEWIGEIPEGWNCLPMKRGLTINNGKDYKNIQTESGYPVIGSGGQFAFASEFLYDGEAVLLGRKGTIDKPMYINGKFWTVDTMFYAVPNEGICCKYMFYQAQTIPFGLYSTNTALPSMTQTDLAGNPMCFPPLQEQQTIADYLDEKTTKIDSAIFALEAQRNDLNALKQSIISEAVIGKIDLREWKQSVEQ